MTAPARLVAVIVHCEILEHQRQWLIKLRFSENEHNKQHSLSLTCIGRTTPPWRRWQLDCNRSTSAPIEMSSPTKAVHRSCLQRAMRRCSPEIAISTVHRHHYAEARQEATTGSEYDHHAENVGVVREHLEPSITPEYLLVHKSVGASARRNPCIIVQLQHRKEKYGGCRRHPFAPLQTFTATILSVFWTRGTSTVFKTL